MVEIVAITATVCITLLGVIGLLVALGIVVVLVVVLWREWSRIGLEDELNHREPQGEIKE